VSQAFADVKEKLIDVVEELAADRVAEVLDFALFIKSRYSEQPRADSAKRVQHLEDLSGDFWPEDKPVDDFVDAVRRWRREDLALHKDLE
jgi:hypothetical protein